jgi:hypothetical protein
MKKLFQFIKNLFVKVDELEQKVEKMVEESGLSTEIKDKVKKTIKKLDDIETKAKKVVDEVEVAEEKVEVAIKTKNIKDITDAVSSVQNAATNAS